MSPPGHSACSDTTGVAAIIPAWNEAATVGAVVYAAFDARLVDHVIAVANPIFLEGLPVLTGQRALRRELFEQLDLRDVRGYRVEAALNSLVAQRDLRRCDQVLPGLWHRTKEEKLANPVVGFVTKLVMLGSACWSYTRFALARRPVQPAS